MKENVINRLKDILINLMLGVFTIALAVLVLSASALAINKLFFERPTKCVLIVKD